MLGKKGYREVHLVAMRWSGMRGVQNAVLRDGGLEVGGIETSCGKVELWWRCWYLQVCYGGVSWLLGCGWYVVVLAGSGFEDEDL